SFLLSARRRRHLPIFPPRRSSDLPPAPLGAPPRGLAGGDAQQGVVLARDPHGGSGPVVPSGHRLLPPIRRALVGEPSRDPVARRDRKSTRLNSSHVKIAYAVFCLK